MKRPFHHDLRLEGALEFAIRSLRANAVQTLAAKSSASSFPMVQKALADLEARLIDAASTLTDHLSSIKSNHRV